MSEWASRSADIAQRRRGLQTVCALALGLSMSLTGWTAPAHAEVATVRLATQPSMSYTPLFVMKEMKLIEKHAKLAGLPEITTVWQQFGNSGVMNDAMLADQLDIASGGPASFLILWDKTRGKGGLEVKGLAAINAIPFYLFMTRPGVTSVKDIQDTDRIGVPAAKNSIQALLLQMAAAQAFGEANASKLDAMTVTIAHPDAYSLLLSGSKDLTGHFSGPPYQYEQLSDPRLFKVLNSNDITGGPATQNMVWSIARFHDANPKTYAAVLAAFDEALAFIKADPKAAAALYAANVKAKIKLETIVFGLSDKETRFSAAPERIMTFADFLGRTSAIKNRPASWKDLFFAELHGRDGS